MNGQIDPALLEQILSMEDPSEDPTAQKQSQLQALATRLRGGMFDMGSPGQMAGQVYMPNTISNVMGMVANGVESKRLQGQADTLGGSMKEQRKSGRTNYFKALSRGLRGGGAAGAGGMDPATTGFPDATPRASVGLMDGLDDDSEY